MFVPRRAGISLKTTDLMEISASTRIKSFEYKKKRGKELTFAPPKITLCCFCVGALISVAENGQQAHKHVHKIEIDVGRI